MHGSPLTSNECVSTLLAYFDRQISTGVPRERAITNAADHFHVAPHKVEYLVDERRSAITELFSVLPGAPDLSNAA